VKHASALLLAAAACGGTHADQPLAQTAPPVVPTPLGAATMQKVDPIAKGVPHGGDVTSIAITEQGDAALTSDSLNSVRLWPTLDGSRPPVPVQLGTEIEQLALAHAGRDLAAIVRDSGGAITVLRLGLDGSKRGRVQIGDDDATFDELVVSGESIITRTSEHVIECYSVDGKPCGRLEPAPGQRVTDLAARGGRIAAITQDASKAYLQWITVSGLTGESLHWQPPIELPIVPREDLFAIAPGDKRIAIAADGGTMMVLDLDWIPRVVAGNELFANESVKSIGFIDHDHAAVASFSMQWWKPTEAPQPSNDPWAVPDDVSPDSFSMSTPALAFADNKVIANRNGMLAISNGTKTQYLGWNVSAMGGFAGAGEHLVMSQSGSRYTWLDDNLHALRSINLTELKPETSSWAYGQALGEHHAISQAYYNDETMSIELIDADDTHKRSTIIPRSKRVEQYFPSDDTVGIKVGKQLRRFKFDLAATTATEMKPSIRIDDYSLNYVRVFDPDKADGLLAVVVSWPTMSSEYQRLTYYKLVNGKVVKEQTKKWENQILRVAATGELTVLAREPAPVIRTIKNGEVIREVKREALTPPFALSNDMTKFATREGTTEIVVFDDKGKDLWRKIVWGVSQMVFTQSGSRLMVTAPGGVIAFDATTGERITEECGFEFGLHDKPSDVGPNGFGFATVCEDTIVQ